VLSSQCVKKCFTYRIGARTTPIPIFRRTRSGYLSRAFSANSLVLKPFDKMTNFWPSYSNRNHRTDVFIKPNAVHRPAYALERYRPVGRTQRGSSARIFLPRDIRPALRQFHPNARGDELSRLAYFRFVLRLTFVHHSLNCTSDRIQTD